MVKRFCTGALAALLVLAAAPQPARAAFSDAAGHWAAAIIEKAEDYGLIQGYPDGTFGPDKTVTRAELMAMVNRATGRAPESTSALLSGMKTWKDNADTARWYYLDVQEATNSHDYDWLGSIEDWTEKLEERDWEALEKLWSDSHDAPGGEVMQ